MSAVKTEPQDILDAINDFLADPLSFTPETSWQLLDAAVEEIEYLRHTITNLEQRTDGPLTVKEILTRHPHAREWFQTQVIDQIDPDAPYAYKDRQQFEAILRLAEKKNPRPTPTQEDKPPGWGQF